jgi:hypothetical protein
LRHPPSSLNHPTASCESESERDCDWDWDWPSKPITNRILSMATGNPELQEKLQELEHELEVSYKVSN